MRDLYERLDLSPDASESAIRVRLSEIDDQELKRAGQEILLRSNRREVYDRNYRTLNLIGKLRSRLNLNDAPNWQGAFAEDFQQSSDDSAHRNERSPRTNTSQSRDSTRSTSENQSGVSAKIVTGIGAVIGGLGKALVRIFYFIGMYLAIISLCGIVVWGISFFDDSSESTSSSEPSAEKTEEPVLEDNTPKDFDDPTTPGQIQEKGQQLPDQSATLSPKPMPSNGTWWKYTSEELIAPLQISVSEGRHYYVKLTDALTDEKVLTIFVRSGATVEVQVPTGSYNLKYAIGETWYGHKHHFGDKTRYMEADDVFDFKIVGQEVRGHRIELIVQRGGNLPTNSIPESEF